ncbi:hypothetical protein RIF29_08384 [Crotalaria pallida]|uniref:ABC transporter family G domain-containing protein n=1 Tax=Crotalaria pallida TaxID=3830 RepID=A0AAN9IIY2_CROPI
MKLCFASAQVGGAQTGSQGGLGAQGDAARLYAAGVGAVSGAVTPGADAVGAGTLTATSDARAKGLSNSANEENVQEALRLFTALYNECSQVWNKPTNKAGYMHIDCAMVYDNEKEPRSCSRAMKAVGVVEATCEEIFELVMSMDGTRFEQPHHLDSCRWDCSFHEEMIVGPRKALFMDEISTGLDSSTTFQIVKCIRNFVHQMEATVLIALLQPAPETFELFDDLVLLSDGYVVYQGPRENVLEFFESFGFKLPPRKGVADFLQEVTSKKDQAQYWADSSKPYKFISVPEIAEAFKNSRFGKSIELEGRVATHEGDGVQAGAQVGGAQTGSQGGLGAARLHAAGVGAVSGAVTPGADAVGAGTLTAASDARAKGLVMGSDAVASDAVLKPLSKLNSEAFAHIDKQEIQLRDRLFHVQT